MSPLLASRKDIRDERRYSFRKIVSAEDHKGAIEKHNNIITGLRYLLSTIRLHSGIEQVISACSTAF